MKIFLTAVIFFTMILTGCRTGKSVMENRSSGDKPAEKQAGTNYADPVTWLLGYINPSQFSKPPHSEWFLKGFDEYQPLGEVIGKLALLNKDDLSIRIVLGTWCPDSRREVPHFMKIIDLLQFPEEKIIFVGVDNNKIAPVGGYDTLGIERVPTFIFMKNKVETGRIIENPVTSLEQDMLNILTGMKNNENK
jgi:thiol-disulfide isomerase/thioredoxin